MSPTGYQSDLDRASQATYSAFSSPGLHSRNNSISSPTWTFSSSSSVSSNCSSPPAHGSTVPGTPIITKIEELDEDNEIKAPPLPLNSPVEFKRGRGRPRKHPVPSIDNTKITKGRSKTGCMTCRRRKKKCDEAKPECMWRPLDISNSLRQVDLLTFVGNNCLKNSVVCEGYPEKVLWQSGRQKAQGMRSPEIQPGYSPLFTAKFHFKQHINIQ